MNYTWFTALPDFCMRVHDELTKTTQFLLITLHNSIHVKIVFDIFVGCVRLWFIFCFAWIPLLIAIHSTWYSFDKNSTNWKSLSANEKKKKQKRETKNKLAAREDKAKTPTHRSQKIPTESAFWSSFLFDRWLEFHKQRKYNFRNRMPIEPLANYSNY